MQKPMFVNMLPQVQDPAGGGAGDPPKTTPAVTPPVAPPVKDPWEAVLAGMTPEQQKLFEEHTTGLKSALDKERGTNKETAAKLKKLDELEKAEAKRKEAELTEAQKAQAKTAELEKKAADLEEQLATTRIKHAVEIEASKQNFITPEDAYVLIDLAKVETTDDGTVKGVEELVKALAKAKPYLIKTTQAGGGGGTPRREPQPGRQTNQQPEKNRKPVITF